MNVLALEFNGYVCVMCLVGLVVCPVGHKVMS